MRVLIADDHSLFRDGLEQLLKQLDEDMTFAHAADLAEAEADLRDAQDDYDLVIIDWRMPGMDRPGAFRHLRETKPDTPVVVISASEDPADIEAAMQAGASGYIPKSSNAQVTLGALRLILESGGIYVPPSLLRNGQTAPGAPPPPRRDERPRLTQRQVEVLRLIADGKSNREIAAALAITEGTAKVHVASIMKSLGVRRRADAVARAAVIL